MASLTHSELNTCNLFPQLLKSLFGTNLASYWEPAQTATSSGKPGKAARMTSSVKPGLYHSCFTTPYTQFTQSLASASHKVTVAAPTDQEDPNRYVTKSERNKISAVGLRGATYHIAQQHGASKNTSCHCHILCSYCYHRACYEEIRLY